jgi:hypothetical protein
VRVTGRVGYTANYAVFAHDPEVKQTFRRATAQKEFLTKGFEDTRSQIDAAVKKELCYDTCDVYAPERPVCG